MLVVRLFSVRKGLRPAGIPRHRPCLPLLPTRRAKTAITGQQGVTRSAKAGAHADGSPGEGRRGRARSCAVTRVPKT